MRALLSVSDKTGIVDLARSLHDRGIEIISTGGTAAAIADAGIPVVAIADVTGFPEMLDGRVKTLHPAIHGGLLARLELSEHREQLEHAGIAPITILVSNLYPFEKTVSSGDRNDAEIVEQIDIGGPAMVRAAAKNFNHVYVVTDPDDYTLLLDMLDGSGADPQAFRKLLAAKAFGHVSTYDSLVANHLRGDDPVATFPQELSIGMRFVTGLRYGENPQQQAAAYRRLDSRQPGILDATQHHGKDLSFNNLLDSDAAWNAIRVSARPTVSIIKHTIPCGLATRDDLASAFAAALEGDPVSAFGGIVACNRAVDLETAMAISGVFFEVIIAPSYIDDALALLRKKKNLRVLSLEAPLADGPAPSLDLRPIGGGMLVQETDVKPTHSATWQVVTERAPTDNEMSDLAYAWHTVRLLKSNAIALASNQAIVGVGAGQPNRVTSVELATGKAGDKAAGASLASDAFFPFPDGIQAGIEAGITAVVHPGGSLNDQQVIDAANDAGIAMCFTGVRHFRH